MPCFRQPYTLFRRRRLDFITFFLLNVTVIQVYEGWPIKFVALWFQCIKLTELLKAFQRCNYYLLHLERVQKLYSVLLIFYLGTKIKYRVHFRPIQ